MTKEKDKLQSIFNEGKISADDFKMLSDALDKKSTRVLSGLTFALNPYQRIAGWHAFIIGMIIIVCMSYLGVVAKVYFPGIITILNASVVKNSAMNINLYWSIYQNIVSWLTLSIVFIIASKVLNRKNVRYIDFLGTIALSRYPFLILVGFLAIIRIVNPSFLEIDIAKGLVIHPSIAMVAFSFIVVLGAIWQIITYYYAFKESTGLTSRKLWIGFIIGIILADIISSPLATMFF